MARRTPKSEAHDGDASTPDEQQQPEATDEAIPEPSPTDADEEGSVQDNGSGSGWWPFGRSTEPGGSASPRVRDLKRRISELERTVADLRRRKDLADLDELELTELGSATAVAMVRAAKERQDQAERFVVELLDDARSKADRTRRDSEEEAERRLTEARSEADDLLAAAREEADRLLVEAEQEREAAREHAERVRQEADEQAARTRATAAAEADKLRASARAEAEQMRADAEQVAKKLRDQTSADVEAMLANANDRADAIARKARADAKAQLSEAASRRDELLASLEHQRRWIRELLDDADRLRGTAIDDFREVRDLLDTVLTRLSDPTARAEEVAAQIDQEAERLHQLTPTRAAAEPQDDPPATEDPPQAEAPGEAPPPDTE